MQPHEKSRPAGNGAAIQQSDETKLSLPLGWHQQTEWEGQWHFAEGFAAGYAAAEKAIAEEITRAVGVKPYSPRGVIRWLCRCIDLDKRELRAEPYSSPENGATLTVEERDLFGRAAA
ncbi:hypothetical protein ACIBPB_03810 [Micromonospora sp. NPDC049836]|uniref:hypothetical protein n=1 Tax=Micromonospora sp. NPDC049836 TaxID=3364274 RepID=UPI0037A05C6C